MTKVKATLIHLLISILVIGAFTCFVYFIWYPKPFFAIAKVIEPIQLMVLVDVIIGPLLTFIVYKKNKKYLKFDLLFIVVVQITALLYGTYIIHQERPNMLVFNSGTFHLLKQKNASVEEIQDESLKPGLFTPPKYGYIKENLTSGIYSSYSLITHLDDDYEEILLPHSLNVTNMSAMFENEREQISKLVSKYNDQEIVFFQMIKDAGYNYVVYSIKSEKIIDYIKF